MKRVQARLYVGIEDGCRLDQANSETMIANLQAASEMDEEGAAEGDGNSAESCCATAVVTDETSVVISSLAKLLDGLV